MDTNVRMHKKVQKNGKKPVDRAPKACYYEQARLRATNLENDTEQRKARTQAVNELSENASQRNLERNRN